MKKLNSKQIKAFQIALISAFSTEELMQKMVESCITDNWWKVVSTGGTLNNNAYQIVCWAIARGSLDELVEGAAKENTDDELLKNFVAEYRKIQEQE